MQKQRIHFARAPDGVSIAYSTMGEGPPLVLVQGWVSHLELDMENPRSADFLEGLSRGGRRRLIRFDIRGSGLSDRNVEDVSIEARARDLEAVVDSVGAEKVAIFAWSMNGPAAMVYAAKHPERISHLILYATFSHQVHSGRDRLGKALVDLIRAEWRIGSRAIVEFEHPEADKETADAINNYQRAAASGEVAARMLEEALFEVDVREHLPKLTMPTLVLHRRDDQAFPAVCGRELASLLPHAHFVPLPGDVHPPFYGDSEAILDAVNEFLATSDGHAHIADQGKEGHAAGRASGLQIILFTDMEGSTTLTQRLGDAQAQELVRTHNGIVRDALDGHDGSEIKHTGDGIMASFSSASSAIGGAVTIQRTLADHNSSNPETPIRVRIGLNAGEPVAEGEDLFGTAVQLAARIAAKAEPGQILVSDVVRQLAAGKGLLFSDQGDVALRGFEDPVRLYEIRWRE
jgi:class 3 adenylate cyclase